MNRKFIYFTFILIGLLFFSPSVNASTKTGINIDAHEHFNYYYEQKNGTGFYNWLKNTDFVDYFGSSTGSNYGMIITYASDYSSSYIGSNCGSGSTSIPTNAKYIVAYRSHPTASINRKESTCFNFDYSMNYHISDYSDEDSADFT